MILRDITEQKREQEKVVRLSRIHSVLSSINALIVRSRDRGHLLQAACRIAVEQGNFGAAWIGLIDENTGRWVIRQALTQQKAWGAGGVRAPRVAVNISAVQLQQADFVEQVFAILPIESGMIDFEITESVLIHNIEDNIQKLQRLRGGGISIAIDEFGIGYSSLSYLARPPINTLKVDRAFVSKMTTDTQSMAVVSAIISLARTLRLKVVAEGVETEEEARFLRLLGCDELQGYLFGRPVGPEETERLLTTAGGNNCSPPR